LENSKIFNKYPKTNKDMHYDKKTAASAALPEKQKSLGRADMSGSVLRKDGGNGVRYIFIR